MIRKSRIAFAAVIAAAATVALAAASQGLAWSKSVTYSDGTAIEAGTQVVYTVYDVAGKQVGTTFEATFPKEKLPADGCYYLVASIYSAAINGKVPASDSEPTANACTKAPPPPQKRVATPKDFRISALPSVDQPPG
jgi:hypothetical protein